MDLTFWDFDGFNNPNDTTNQSVFGNNTYGQLELINAEQQLPSNESYSGFPEFFRLHHGTRAPMNKMDIKLKFQGENYELENEIIRMKNMLTRLKLKRRNLTSNNIDNMLSDLQTLIPRLYFEIPPQVKWMLNPIRTRTTRLANKVKIINELLIYFGFGIRQLENNLKFKKYRNRILTQPGMLKDMLYNPTNEIIDYITKYL